jgi:hypothetical protein
VVAQEVLHAKDLTMKHDRVMYLWLGQICGGGGAPVALVAGWMPNGRSVDGGPERRFDGGRRGRASYGGRRGGDSYSRGGSYGDGGSRAPMAPVGAPAVVEGVGPPVAEEGAGIPAAAGPPVAPAGPPTATAAAGLLVRVFFHEWNRVRLCTVWVG